MRRASWCVALVAGLVPAIALVGCGPEDDAGSSTPTTAAETTTTMVAPATSSTSSAPTTSDAPTTTVAPTTTAPPTTAEPTTTTSPPSTTTLPGDPVDWVVAGTVAHVAGVAWDETFSIFALPGDGEPVAADLPSLTELTLTGNGRIIDTGKFGVTWVEVTGGGATGWISLWSLVYLGGPRDLTADAIAAFVQPPLASSMLDLGELVIDEIAPVDPNSAGSSVVRASDPATGTPNEVVYDVFPGEDEGDDTAIGVRYWVVGQELPSGDYELMSVEARTLCTRGADATTGFCV